MRLHQDKDAFRVLLDDVHSKTGYRIRQYPEKAVG